MQEKEGNQIKEIPKSECMSGSAKLRRTKHGEKARPQQNAKFWCMSSRHSLTIITHTSQKQHKQTPKDHPLQKDELLVIFDSHSSYTNRKSQPNIRMFLLSLSLSELLNQHPLAPIPTTTNLSLSHSHLFLFLNYKTIESIDKMNNSLSCLAF